MNIMCVTYFVTSTTHVTTQGGHIKHLCKNCGTDVFRVLYVNADTL